MMNWARRLYFICKKCWLIGGCDDVKTEALAEGLECTLSVFSFSG